jgi:hypothetical protein
MKTLAANINNTIPGAAFNDLYLDGDGSIVMSFDIQAVKEACAQAAQTILGEVIYNTSEGIPYFETLWVGVPNTPQFEAALRSAFLNVPNVTEVVSLLTSQENNTLTYNAVIRTTFGSTAITGVIING